MDLKKLCLRPHHTLCIFLFDPNGHSTPYSEIIYRLIDIITGNPQQEVFLCVNLDVICGYCPHNENGICGKSDEVCALDNTILALCGLNMSKTLTWEELRTKLKTIGWHIFISKCLNLDKLSPTDKIALIVDSELDKYEKYNYRALPYYKGYYLPKQIKFIYASSDVGKSKYLANQMISYCDAMSKKVLDHIKEEKIKILLLNNGDENYDGYLSCYIQKKG
jgi:hypothetical protein